MRRLRFFIILCILSSVLAKASPAEEQCEAKPKNCALGHKGGSKKFPDTFQFGVSTAAYQIEGGWDADGKGPSIWDTYTHEHPEMIADHSNGDVAADSYHRFEQDLVALKELKVDFYRFSVSWPRILPTGDVSSLNQKGLDYYNMIINKLLENGIEPLITMFHYDMPAELNKLGGFANELFIKYFADYADVLYKNFGDRVKHWITFNEPADYCNPGYGTGKYPPMVHAPGVVDYLCMDVTLKSHAVAYRLYKARYFDKQAGKVGITISSRFFYVKGQDNVGLVERAMQFGLGWLATPIFGSGNYPQVVIDTIKANSKKEGRGWSRLPELGERWQSLIKGSADFLGLNYYTSRYVEDKVPKNAEIPSWEYDSHLSCELDPSWKHAKSTWLYCVPQGLEDLLKWIRGSYGNIEVFVTENGWSDSGQLEDTERVDYLKAHVQAVLNAVNSGCNVTRYTHWSLIDNFEWQQGYTEKFGLYYVDVTSANKDRVAKESAHFYRRVIEQRSIPEN